MKPEEIDRLYKLTFDQYKGEAPEELWEDIATEVGPKRGRRGFIWLIGGIFVLGIGLLAGQTLFTSLYEKEPASDTVNTSVPDSIETRSLENISKATTANKQFPLPTVLANTPDIPVASKILVSPSIVENSQAPSYDLHSPMENMINPIKLNSPSVPLSFSLPTHIYHKEKRSTFMQETSQHKRSFYADVSHFLAYHHIHPNLEENVFTSFPSVTPDLSFGRSGLSAEVGFIQPLSPRIYLKLGVSSMYYKQNFKLEQITFSGYNLVSGSDLKSGVTLKPALSQAEQETAKMEILDIGIHTSLGFRLGNRPKAAVIETGFKTYFPLKGRELSMMGEDSFSDGRISYKVAINGRIPVAVSASSQLMIGPSLTYGLTNWSFQEGPFSIRPYQVGVGITYIFLSGL